MSADALLRVKRTLPLVLALAACGAPAVRWQPQVEATPPVVCDNPSPSPTPPGEMVHLGPTPTATARRRVTVRAANVLEASPTPTSRWYGEEMAEAMAAVQTPCPLIPLGCFGQPPLCEADLCYCVRVCEPRPWLPALGRTDTASGVWAGRGTPCLCRETP